MMGNKVFPYPKNKFDLDMYIIPLKQVMGGIFQNFTKPVHPPCIKPKANVDILPTLINIVHHKKCVEEENYSIK